MGVGVTRALLLEPLKLTMWGLPVASSTIETVPVLVPVPVGLKTTLIVHVELSGRIAPQVLVPLKSPVIEILEIAIGMSPLLVTVVLCGALVFPMTSGENWRDAGEKLNVETNPRPDSVTTCGVSNTVTISAPVKVPLTVGENRTLTVQTEPGPMGVGQLFELEKSPMVMTLVNVNGTLPVFEILRFKAELVVPTRWSLKTIGSLESVNWPVAFPDRLTTLLLVELLTTVN